MAKTKNTGLGRGLDAIFYDNAAEPSDNITMLRVSTLEPRPGQPRRIFNADAMSSLAESIAAHGVIQPVVVRPADNGFYMIIAGERRWRAAKLAGLTELPVIIMDVDDKKASEIALIENIQREDLNAMEEAAAYKTLLEEYNLTQEELSRSVGRSRSSIANMLRLLELPPEVASLVETDKLSAGHAKALLGLSNRAHLLKAAEAVVSRGMSVRDCEAMVRSMNRSAEIEAAAANDDSAVPKIDYKFDLSRKITEKMGRRVKIVESSRARKVEIEYSDNDDLDLLIKLLCGDLNDL